MALKWEEIQDLRSRVPREYQPWLNAPASTGPDSELDADAAVGEVDNRARESERTIFNLGMNATRVGNFIATGAMATRLAQTEQARQEERRKDDKFALDRAREALERRLAEIEARLREIDDEIDDIDERREAIRKQREAIEELRRLKAEGKFDPTDPAQAALLRDAGFSAADVQGADFDDKAKGRDGELGREDTGLQTRRDTRVKERDDLRRERRDIGDTITELDTAPTPERRAIAETRARTLAGALELSSAAAATTNQETRAIAAEAVGQNEVSAVRVASAQDNESAIRADSIQQLSSADASGFDFDAPSTDIAASTSAASSIAPATAFPNAPDAGAAFASATGRAAPQPQQVAEIDVTTAPDNGATRLLLPRNG